VRHCQTKAVSVIERMLFGSAIIESERLFGNVAMKMKRFNTHIRSMQSAFQERPEIFHAVGVNQSAQVLFSVIDDFAVVIVFKARVGAKFIGIQFGSSAHVLLDHSVKSIYVAVFNHFCPDLTWALVASTLKCSHNNYFADNTGANSQLAAILV